MMSKDVTAKLEGETLNVVELVEEKQIRIFNDSKGDCSRQSTNHVTDCKSLQFTQSDKNAKVNIFPFPQHHSQYCSTGRAGTCTSTT